MESPQSGTGAITGWVSSPSGEPLPNVVVMITGDSPSHPDIAALTDAAGRYRYDNLAPGQYEITVNSERFGLKTAETQVEAERVSRLDFTLPE